MKIHLNPGQGVYDRQKVENLIAQRDYLLKDQVEKQSRIERLEGANQRLLKVALGECPECGENDLHSAAVGGKEAVSCTECDWIDTYEALAASDGQQCNCSPSFCAQQHGGDSGMKCRLSGATGDGADGVALNSMSHADLPPSNPLRTLTEDEPSPECIAAVAKLMKVTKCPHCSLTNTCMVSPKGIMWQCGSCFHIWEKK